MNDTSQVRLLKNAEDLLQFRKIQSTAFVSSFDSLNYEYKPHTGPSTIWGYGTPATSSMVIHDFDTWFDGHLVKTTGVGGVATLPEARGQGGIRDIFAALLPAWRENDVVFSTLYPFSHVFYRKFGYELVQRGHEYTVPMDSLKDFHCEHPVEMISDPESIKKLYREFGSKQNLCICRKDSQWDRISKDPFKDRRYTYRIGDVAYVTFKPVDPEGENGYTLRVLDVAYCDSAALRSVLGFLYAMRAQYHEINIKLPASVPLMHMVPECYNVHLEVNANGMGRIVNVPRALELMRYPDRSGAFSVQVTDDSLPINTGCYLVHFAGGQAVSVEKIEGCEDPDLTVNVQVLTQLVVGALTVDEALYLEGVQCPAPARLRDVFIRKDIHFTDGF